MSGKRLDLDLINRRIFEKANVVFPELELQPVAAGGWRSAKKLNGMEPRIKRGDKTVITKTAPNRLLEQGGESLTFWDYVAQRDNLEKSKVIYRLAELAGYEHDREPTTTVKKAPQMTAQEAPAEEVEDYQAAYLLESSHSYFLEQMRLQPEDSKIKKYLREQRGYTGKEIESMELGFIPSQGEFLYSLKSLNFSQEEIEGLGLNGFIGKTHQLVIPFRHSGKIVSFSFRNIEHNKEAESPKYINLKGFSKNKYLFNFPAEEVPGDLVLVEGELDALAATARGILDVVALKGSTLLSSEQLEIVRSAKPKRVVLCFDADEAGAAASEKIKTKLIEEEIPCAVVSLPEGYDPDQYIRENGAEDFFSLIQAAKTLRIKELDTSCTNFLELQERIASRPNALKTGYPSLDKKIRIPIGAITLIAGRPGEGKTTMLYNLMLSMAEVYKEKKFYFFTYEESEADILLKILTCLIGKDFFYGGDHFAKGYKDEDGELPTTNLQLLELYIKANGSDISEIEEGKAKLDKLLREDRIQVVSSFLAVERLKEILNRTNAREDIGAVFIDYAQKIPTEEPSVDMRLKVMTISENFRELAVESKLPLIIGAQFNRSKNNDNEAPTLGRLKEAANLEEDANLVLGLHEKKIHVLKSRNGAASEIIDLTFRLEKGKIEDPQKETKATFGKVKEGLVL